MNTREKLIKLNEFKTLNKELEYINKNQKEVDKKTKDEIALKFETISKNIQNFCGNPSFTKIIKNFCYLYSDILSISNGNLLYRGSLLPSLSYDYNDAFSVTNKCLNDIKASFTSLANGSNNIDNDIKKLCISFITLRRINASVNYLKEKAIDYALSNNTKKQEIEQKIGALLKEIPELKDPTKVEEEIEKLNNKIKEEIDYINFKNIKLPIDYSKEITLPFSYMVEDDEVLVNYWNPIEDGILNINIKDGDSSLVTNFIISLIMQFLYSYPMMDKKIVYNCKRSRRDIDGFLGMIKDICADSVFFKGIEQVSGDDYATRQLFSDLQEEGRRRSKLMMGYKDIYEYNAQDDVEILSPILVILNDYPSCFPLDDVEYFFRDSIELGIFCVAIQTSFEEKKYNLDQFEKIKCDIVDKETLNIGENNYKCVHIERENIKPLLESIKVNGKKNTYLSYEEIGFGKVESNTEGYCCKVSIPIGKINNKTFSLDFAAEGEAPVAYLIIGEPGSGKSSLIDAITINGSMAYSPDDLIFYMLDFKNAVSAAFYSNNPIQNVKMIATKCNEGDADIVLSLLKEELDRRCNEFGKYDTNDIVGYNQVSSKKMPRIIFMVDECQDLFANEKLTKKLNEIVSKGRASGIHLVLATQRITMNMKRNAGDLIKGRFCFYAEKNIAEDVINPKYTRSLSSDIPKGSGLAYMSQNGSNGDCKIIHIAYSGKDDKKRIYNEKIRDKWNERNYKIDLVKAGYDAPLLMEDFINKGNTFASTFEKSVNIGENFFDQSSVNIDFSNEKSPHTIIVQGNEKRISTDILTSIMIGALTLDADIKLIDGSIKNKVLTNFFNKYQNVKTYSDDEYLDALEEINNEYEKRWKRRSENHKPLFIVINSLNEIRSFTKNEKLENSDTSTYNSDDNDEMTAFYNRMSSQDFEKSISGKDTLIELLTDDHRNANMYFIISYNSNSIDYNIINCFKEFDYKIVQNNSNKIEDLTNVFFSAEAKKRLNENIVLIFYGESSLKCRYFQYNFESEKLYELVDEVIKNGGNE